MELRGAWAEDLSRWSKPLIPPQERATKSRREHYAHGGLVEEDGFEPSKAKPADLQSVPFGHLGTPP